MPTIKIVRDVLDKRLVDRNNANMGRVDGVLLRIPEGGQPRVEQIAMGGEILAARAMRWLVRPTRWLREHFGPKRSAEVRIDWKRVTRMGHDLHLDLSADSTEALAWEHWLAKNVVGRIPGAR